MLLLKARRLVERVRRLLRLTLNVVLLGGRRLVQLERVRVLFLTPLNRLRLSLTSNIALPRHRRQASFRPDILLEPRQRPQQRVLTQRLLLLRFLLRFLLRLLLRLLLQLFLELLLQLLLFGRLRLDWLHWVPVVVLRGSLARRSRALTLPFQVTLQHVNQNRSRLFLAYFQVLLQLFSPLALLLRLQARLAVKHA